MARASQLQNASALDAPVPTHLVSARRRGRGKKKQPLPKLFDGVHITCPRCRRSAPILDTEVLPEMPLFRDQTIPVLRCSSCRFIFALQPDAGRAP